MPILPPQPYPITVRVQIDDVNGFDNTLVAPFKERIEANGMTVDDLNLVGISKNCMTIRKKYLNFVRFERIHFFSEM